MSSMIKNAHKLAGAATHKATGMATGTATGMATGTATDIATRKATGMAVKAAGKMAGSMVAKVAIETAKLADKLDPGRPEPGAIKVDVRKIVSMVEEIWHEGGPMARKPYRRGAIAAVVANPFAGRYVEDLTPMMDALKPLGFQLAAELIKALGGAKKVGLVSGICG